MADRPILFSGPMVRAIFAGAKTQMRRLLDLATCDNDEPPAFVRSGAVTAFGPDDLPHRWPRTHAVGDRCWVREAWRTQAAFDRKSPAAIVADFEDEWGSPSIPTFYEADKRCDNHSVEQWQESPIGRLRAGIHMPRCASRITLLVTDVHVERLQDISEEDAWDKNPWIAAYTFKATFANIDTLAGAVGA